MESFSKLADSIYFKHMPDVGPSTAASTANFNGTSTSSGSGQATAAGAGAGASARPAGGAGSTAQQNDGPLPELWVNQLVSSSVRWRELRTVARQEAGGRCFCSQAGRRSLWGCTFESGLHLKRAADVFLVTARRQACWWAGSNLICWQMSCRNLVACFYVVRHRCATDVRFTAEAVWSHGSRSPRSTHLPAELYGPNNTVVSRLIIDIYPPEANFPEGPAWGASRSVHSSSHSANSSRSGSEGASQGVAGEESRRFALNWRIPG